MSQQSTAGGAQEPQATSGGTAADEAATGITSSGLTSTQAAAQAEDRARAAGTGDEATLGTVASAAEPDAPSAGDRPPGIAPAVHLTLQEPDTPGAAAASGAVLGSADAAAPSGIVEPGLAGATTSAGVHTPGIVLDSAGVDITTTGATASPYDSPDTPAQLVESVAVIPSPTSASSSDSEVSSDATSTASTAASVASVASVAAPSASPESAGPEAAPLSPASPSPSPVPSPSRSEPSAPAFSSPASASRFAGAPVRVRAWWRAFPVWERRALAAIVLFAAVMYGWEAAHASYHGFYAVAVRSMTTGWRAFVFGALDPNASITIDKIPGFLWPQALSALAFGFHPWSLALPQAIEGVVAVVGLHAAVRRWIGPAAGVTAAGVFALTPVAASLFGKVLEDAALTCLLVLAAAAWQRAVETGRLRSLVLCGVWVGLAFQAKMLQSWAVLPAFALVYLLAAPPRFLVRLRHTLVAGAVCLAVSLSWVIIATVTPAGDRPYVDGSTNNSAAAMVFGYNGLARFGSVGVSAAGTGSVAATQGARFGGGTSSSGWLKLLQHDLASQVGWLYPVALAGIAFGLWRRGRGRTDGVRAGALMWTGWLLLTGLALSAGSVPHSTYVVALAPPLAALGAYALVRTVAMYRAPRTTAERLALPALTAVTLAWAIHLSVAFPRFLPGIALPLSAAAVTVVALAVVVGRATGRRSGMTRWSAGLCCGLMLAVPAAWSASVFDPAYAGSSGNANAGGYQGGMHFGLRTATQPRHAVQASHLMFNPFNPPSTLDAAQSRLLSYLADHRDGARYLVATESWGAASPYILTDEAAILPMGGFSGNAGFPQPQQFESMIKTGEIHYVLLTGQGMHFRGTPAADGPGAALPGATTPGAAAPTARGRLGMARQPRAHSAAAPVGAADSDLSRVAALVTKSCRLVPTSAYGAVPQETAPLYRCG